MQKDSTAFARGLQALFVVVVIGGMVASSALGSIGLFRMYNGAFSRLVRQDTVTAQQLYNDTASRIIKDNLLQQQNDATNVQLAAEVIARESGFWELYWAILNETSARIAEEAPLFTAIANETAARISADLFIEAEIYNLTLGVVAAEAYEAFSISKFMILMQNITDLVNALTLDTAARIAADIALTEQGALADAAIAYLADTFAHDVHDRTVQDVLIDEWIAAIQAMNGGGIFTINGRSGDTHHDIDIVSTNFLTTITEPSPGQLIFTNNAVRTMQGVLPDGAGNIVLTVQPPLNVVANGPHGLHIYSTSLPIGPNIDTLFGMSGVPIPLSNYATVPAAVYSTIPCMFPSFNGGSCGWSAPDSNTYIVQVTVVLTVILKPHSIFPAAVHLNMGLGVGTYSDVANNAWEEFEPTTGLIRTSDGANAGDGEVPIRNPTFDMGLTATTIVQGGGSGGCWFNCGYGVWIYLKGFIQDSTSDVVVQAITAQYTVTKVP